MSFWFTVSMLLLLFIFYQYRARIRAWVTRLQKMYTFPRALANGIHHRPTDINEYILTERDSLQARVLELEKLVAKQQNEMMLLRTTTADILARIGRLEATRNSNGTSNGEATSETPSNSPASRPRLPPRSQSQSSYSLANSASPSRLTRSLYVPCEQSPSIPEASSRRTSQAFMNVSVGRSVRGSPMRKWLSHVDVGGSPTPSTSGRLQYAPSIASNISSIGRAPSRRASTSTLFQSRRSISGQGLNQRDPAFQAAAGVLVIHVQGRSVALPVPSNVEEIDPLADQPPPVEKPKLDWVYGYRGKDVRHSLEYLPTGELVYFSGCVVVLYNEEDNTQRHYVEHTSDVKSISVHPNRHVIATGQSSRHNGERPTPEHKSPVLNAQQLEKQLEQEHTEAHVRIWDSINLTTLTVISSGFEKGVGCLSFSSTDAGNLLACVDESFQHNLSVWDWQKQTKIAENKGANDQVFGCFFHPTIKGKLIMYGKGHFSFWQLESEGGFLLKNAISFEGRDKPKTVLSACVTPEGQVVTGDSNGTISLWDANSYRMTKQAHSVHPGGVFILAMSKKGSLWSVGKDRNVAEWEPNDLVKRRRPVELPDEAGLPRSIVFAEGSKVLIGCSTNTIFSGDMDLGFTDYLQGDNDDVIACVPFPSGTAFLTASRDGGLRMWNTQTRKPEWFKNYGEPIECISLSPTGELCAVGFSSGVWSIVDMVTRETVSEQKESTHPVTCVQFAPNGHMLLVATKDLSALFYKVDGSRRVHRVFRIGALSSWVVSADWDSESSVVRVNTSAGHLHHYNTVGEQLEPSGVRDLTWKTTNCRLSYESGCATHSTTGVTCVIGSESILALGRENGTIRLYKNPVTSAVAGHHEMTGHGYAVSSLCFARNLLISSGCNDASLLQWKIT